MDMCVCVCVCVCCDIMNHLLCNGLLHQTTIYTEYFHWSDQ